MPAAPSETYSRFVIVVVLPFSRRFIGRPPTGTLTTRVTRMATEIGPLAKSTSLNQINQRTDQSNFLYISSILFKMRQKSFRGPNFA